METEEPIFRESVSIKTIYNYYLEGMETLSNIFNIPTTYRRSSHRSILLSRSHAIRFHWFYFNIKMMCSNDAKISFQIIIIFAHVLLARKSVCNACDFRFQRTCAFYRNGYMYNINRVEIVLLIYTLHTYKLVTFDCYRISDYKFCESTKTDQNKLIVELFLAVIICGTMNPGWI